MTLWARFPPVRPADRWIRVRPECPVAPVVPVYPVVPIALRDPVALRDPLALAGLCGRYTALASMTREGDSSISEWTRRCWSCWTLRKTRNPIRCLTRYITTFSVFLYYIMRLLRKSEGTGERPAGKPPRPCGTTPSGEESRKDAFHPKSPPWRGAGRSRRGGSPKGVHLQCVLTKGP